MPELPEVETIVRDLQRLAVGRRIQSVRVRLNKLVRTGPRRLAKFIIGSDILSVRRRGKFIVFHLSGRRYMVVHLKMTGQFLWEAPPAEWPNHVHLMIGFEGDRVLLYRDMRQFGFFLGLTEDEYADWVLNEEIGPDPFQVTPGEFALRLAGRRGRIKALLLNQRFISGLGNIYVDESLFASGIHPLCPAGAISEEQARRLHDNMTRILKRSIRLRGSTTGNYVGLRGVGGRYQAMHLVYGRSGEACYVCGTPLTRLVVAGRGTTFCPRCQPA